MTRIVFALERDAKTDPPDHYNPVLVGYAEHKYDSRPDTGFLSYREGVWGSWVDDLGFVPVPFQPSWWLDIPRGVEGEGLTINDLRETVECVEAEAQWNRQANPPNDFEAARLYRMAARLRAALDALEGDET